MSGTTFLAVALMSVAAGAWNGDGTDSIGVYDPSSAVFRLRNALSAGNPDAQFRFGPRNGRWRPIAGAW